MKKILVIDDNLNNLENIRTILNADWPDYMILLAHSAADGIEIAKKELPDTIIVDYLVQNVDGQELCEFLKNQEKVSLIPILLVVSADDAVSRIGGYEGGADAVVSRPFENTELKAQLNILLRIKFAEDLLRKRNKNLEILIKRQTTEFHNLEDRYLKVSEDAVKFYWEVDPSGLITFISPLVAKILGHESREIIGKKYIYDLCAYTGSEHTRQLIFRIFKAKSYYDGNELLCAHKRGGKVWLTISGLPIFNEGREFSGYIGVCRDISKRKEAEEANTKNLEQIKKYQKKLKNLNYELAVAEERERRKIAEHLHDGLGQTLSIASIKLSALINEELPENVKAILHESSELISEGIAESRAMVYDLSPPILYELGLVAAIKWKVEQIEKNFGINTDFESGEAQISLDSDSIVLLFRIVCELMNNSIRHSGADLVKVKIHQDPKKIDIMVIDNGKGFDYNRESNLSEIGGFGLFSINERLDTLGGSLVIDSVPNHGAKIKVTVPI
jgi:PAS domain S-box-containing protein